MKLLVKEYNTKLITPDEVIPKNHIVCMVLAGRPYIMQKKGGYYGDETYGFVCVADGITIGNSIGVRGRSAEELLNTYLGKGKIAVFLREEWREAFEWLLKESEGV